MPKPATDWTGYQYSFLTVLKRGSIVDAHGRVKWVVRCLCGKEFEMDIRDLRKRERAGKPISCGCMKRKLISEAHKTHAMTKHPAYAVWRSMKARCENPRHRAWKNYGGRGITVCERWANSFENFWADMGPTYEPGLDLDRKDNNSGYSPENCRWVSRLVNCRNKRASLLVETPEGRLPLKELARQSGVKYTTLLYRLAHGCPPEKLTTPANVRNRFTTS